MAQLADRVRQLERLKIEKAKATKTHRREKVAYVEMDDDDPETSSNPTTIEESEIDLAELKHGPPYSCRVLLPSDGKNPIESEKNNDIFPKKTYSFNVTKCDEMFDLLVKDGQMIVPPGAKMPPLEHRKKRGFCKYHNFLGHKTSQYFLFRDLVRGAIKEGRLKFADRP